MLGNDSKKKVSRMIAEDERLKILTRLGAVGGCSNASLDAIAQAAAAILDGPMAVVTLVDADRVIAKASFGLAVNDMPRAVSFCTHAILSDDVMVVPDAMLDARFVNSPIVASDPHIRSYAGSPLISPDGARIGVLCVLDTKPRPSLLAHERRALETLAELAMEQLLLGSQDLKPNDIADIVKEDLRPLLAVNASGVIEYANLAAARLLGRSPVELRRRPFDAIIAPGALNAGCETLIAVYAKAGDRHGSKPLQRLAILDDGGERAIEITVRPWAAADGAGMVVLLRRALEFDFQADVVNFPRSPSGRSTQADIVRALENGEFLLHYQPQVTMQTRQAFAVEALVRWNNPERGMMLPKSFLIDIEENGFALPLGWWILDAACAQLATWRDQGVPLRRISVNLCTAQYRSEALVRRVQAALAENRLSPDMLELEVTETIALLHDERGLSSLRALAKMGVRIAFDDFGTGYASLSSLQQFPLTTLKLDRRFICDILSRKTDAVITKSMIGLARELGLESVAEGIETLQQHQLLVEMGCEAGQGFLYGRPVSAEHVPAVLRRCGFALTEGRRHERA